MTEKKLRELEALIASKDDLRPYEVAGLWGLEPPAATKYLNEFKEEMARLDSKLPGYGLTYHTKKAQWVDRDVFRFFMKNYPKLMDEVRRKTVAPYRKGWEEQQNELG